MSAVNFGPGETALAIAAAADGTKPIVASFMGGQDILPGKAEPSPFGSTGIAFSERVVPQFRLPRPKEPCASTR